MDLLSWGSLKLKGGQQPVVIGHVVHTSIFPWVAKACSLSVFSYEVIFKAGGSACANSCWLPRLPSNSRSEKVADVEPVELTTQTRKRMCLEVKQLAMSVIRNYEAFNNTIALRTCMAGIHTNSAGSPQPNGLHFSLSVA